MWIKMKSNWAWGQILREIFIKQYNVKKSDTTTTPSPSPQEESCPLCLKYPTSTKSKRQQEQEQNGTPDWIRHFLLNCDYVNKNIVEELEKAESQETETIIKLDGIDIRKICIIGDLLSKSLNHNHW